MANVQSLIHMDLRHALREAVLEDRNAGSFKVNRRVFVDDAVLALERQAIFDHCWLYLGHASEVPRPGSFVTRKISGRPLLFNRDRHGKLRAFYNTCSHRGAVICREHTGTRRAFQCPYHGWVYDDLGTLVGVPGRESMAPGLIEGGSMNLTPVPKIDEFRGFVFINFDSGTGSLPDYLAGAQDILSLMGDHGENGMEIVGGSQDYSIGANWKLLQENSADSYHAATTHSTYFDYVASRDRTKPGVRISEETRFTGVRDMGNGHAVIESVGSAPWGRPYARWVPGWGEQCRSEIDEIARSLVARLGEERGRRISHGDRNTLIFPNLVINDIMAITIRTFYPVRPDYMEVSAWALAPVGESLASRDRRLRNFLEFLGPAGFASPDDVEMLEMCQDGYNNRIGVEWNDISKGLLKSKPERNDEEQMRVFWRRWKALLNGAEAKPPGEDTHGAGGTAIAAQ